MTSTPTGGSIREASKPIVVEEVFGNPVQRVWSAITSVDEMTVWFFENIPAFRPVVGFETAFNMQSGARTFQHQWQVTEVIPGRKISYRWTYPDYPGDSLVTFELEEDDKGYGVMRDAIVAHVRVVLDEIQRRKP